MEVNDIIAILVAINVDELDDNEVLALYLSALTGQSFEGKLGAEKLEPLYTEGDYKMTSDVKAIFMALAGQRVLDMKNKK